MKAHEKKKATVQVTEGTPATGAAGQGAGITRGALKKPLVFSSMALLFLGCLYLIFGGGDEGKSGQQDVEIGINAAVPQASGNGLPSDKGKAYEQEMLEEKDRKKRETLMTLSDYWQSDSTVQQSPAAGDAAGNAGQAAPPRDPNPALSSYRNMQQSLGNFYQKDPVGDAVQKENERLKAALQQQASQVQKPDDRLALMEKSYQMAAKYFPGSMPSRDTLSGTPSKQNQEADFITVAADPKTVVSQLYRYVPDSLLLSRITSGGQRGFTTAGSPQEIAPPPNSIRACIHQSFKLVGEGSVQLRLLQDVRIGKTLLPGGSVVTGTAKFQGNRLHIQVVSVEIGGNIVPVNLTAYDLDGQKGLNLPYAPEVTAVNGTLANMGNTGGSSFTLNRSAGQQLTSDMTRGLIQGVSGYFSKKVTAQKATLTQGYQLFLVSKKK